MRHMVILQVSMIARAAIAAQSFKLKPAGKGRPVITKKIGKISLYGWPISVDPMPLAFTHGLL